MVFRGPNYKRAWMSRVPDFSKLPFARAPERRAFTSRGVIRERRQRLCGRRGSPNSFGLAAMLWLFWETRSRQRLANGGARVYSVKGKDSNMTQAGYSSLAAVLMGAASIGAADAQDAFAMRQNRDGTYAVDIVTLQGSCNKDYHWLILVSDGRVSSAGNTAMDASGQVSRRGIVDLAFERFGQVATVTGKIAMGSGSGTWSSPTMQCAGSWRATRQG
jgi:uncharacterized protein (DUF2147 family)